MLITKSVKDDITFGKFKDATPSTVVGSAYDTSGNGGRKLVKLSNGWLVAGTINGANVSVYVSKDNGATWSTTRAGVGASSMQGCAIAADGTTVHLLFTYNNNTACYQKYNALTDSNTITSVVITSSETAVGNCSLCIDGTGTLHAAWSSKNSTFPNSFNIRYSKSTDGGTTWAAPSFRSSYNVSGANMYNPCIVARANNQLTIIAESEYAIIYCWNWNGVDWGGMVTIYASTTGSLRQYNPCGVVDESGVIHVVWHGTDAASTTFSTMKYSKSTDGGITWSTMSKIPSNQSYNNELGSLAIKDNLLYLVHRGSDTAHEHVTLRKFDGTSWTVLKTITDSNATPHPSILKDDVQWIYRAAASVVFDASPRPKVPDTSPAIPEIYIPLWWYSGNYAQTANAGSGTAFLGKSVLTSTNTNDSRSKLHTLNASWTPSLKYAIEVAMQQQGGTGYVALWDITTNSIVSASQVSATSTTFIVMRSGQFTLIPGHVYGINWWGDGSVNHNICDISLIVFPS